jgi:hypothetical protein
MTPAIDWRTALAMSEDRGPESLDAHLRQMMAVRGLWGYHTRNSIGAQRGWPDWVILGPCGSIFAELKSERGTLSPDQRHVGSMLTRAGHQWVVWRPRDLLDGTIDRQLDRITARSEVA